MRSAGWGCLLFAALLLGGSADSYVSPEREWGVVTEQEWATSAPADYPEANAVILFDHGHQTIEIIRQRGLYPEATFKRHVRIKILRAEGVNAAGDMDFPYDPDAGLQDVKAQTILPDGRTFEVAEDAMFEQSIGDRHFRSFAFPHLETGCIVEYTYTTYDDNVKSVAPWYFHNSMYTLESGYTLEVGAGFRYAYQTRNMPPEIAKPITAEMEGLGKKPNRSYTWIMRSLPPIAKEPFMTCVEDYKSAVHVLFKGLATDRRYYEGRDTWPEIAMLFESVLDDYTKLQRGFRKIVHDVVRGRSTDYEKAKAIYNFMTDSIVTRQSGFRLATHHDRLGDVLDDCYGTSMEKNLLMIEMLRKQHIDAWPILIPTRDQGRFDAEWLDLDQFNHLIAFVEVEQGGIYLDASSKYCAFGTLPPLCRTNVGLLLDGDKSELVRIVTNDPVSYRLDVTTVNINPDGAAACSTSAVLCGYLAAQYGINLETSDPESFIRERLLGDPDAGYVPGDYETTLDSLNRLFIRTDYALPDLGDVLDRNLVVTPPCCLFEENPFDSKQRFFPIDFNFPFTYQNVVRLQGPPDAGIADLPHDTSFAIDGISYERILLTNGSNVEVNMKVSIEKPFFDVDEYDQVRSFFESVQSVNRDAVVFAMEGQ